MLSVNVTTTVKRGLTTLLFWQHTGLDLHEDEPTPAAESGEHWRPIWPVTSPSPRPSVDRIAVPAAESDYERVRQSSGRNDSDIGRTFSRLLQHWTGPVLQLWAAARIGRARARAATRANILGMIG